MSALHKHSSFVLPFLVGHRRLVWCEKSQVGILLNKDFEGIALECAHTLLEKASVLRQRVL